VGNSIADVVLFNGTSKAFEIKTELDSDKRLNGQMADYTKLFKECYIVTHEALVEKYLKEDESFGIIELKEYPRSLKMRTIRSAKENKTIDPEAIIRSIRSHEYKSIVEKYYGELPNVNSYEMFNSCRSLIMEIPNDKLNMLFIEQLKSRKSNTNILSNFYREIRQLGLAMNINAETYQQLFLKLNKPIQI